MKLLIFDPPVDGTDFPFEVFSMGLMVYRGGDLSGVVGRVGLSLVAENSEIPDEVLSELLDFSVVSCADDAVIEQASPGDVALLAWDDSDRAYSILRSLTRSGVLVLDCADDFVELVLDSEWELDDLIETITERVTERVLKALRDDPDTPSRRSRFRSPAPRA